MCGVWDGWVVSNRNCPARVRAAFVSSAQLRVRTRILRWVWRRSNPAAARGLTQCVSLSGVRIVDGWDLSNLDLCARVRVLRLSFRRKLLRPYSHFALGVASARSIPARRGM